MKWIKFQCLDKPLVYQIKEYNSMQIESTVAQILQSTTFQFERQIGNVFPQNVAQNRGELQAVGFAFNNKTISISLKWIKFQRGDRQTSSLSNKWMWIYAKRKHGYTDLAKHGYIDLAKHHISTSKTNRKYVSPKCSSK